MLNIQQKDELENAELYLGISGDKKEDLIRLQFKNERSAYLYWYFEDEKIKVFLSEFGCEGDLNNNLVLRLEYSGREGEAYKVFRELEVSLDESSLYLNDLKSGSSYIAKLGAFDNKGVFRPYLESNEINLPSGESSDLSKDGEKIYILSKGDSFCYDSSYNLSV
ncbi:DUF4912 domain-containing protein [Halonatronum saccharophilum]|uniref:DUF4912 domain-containing protein n=1 Tax=Halonatronum saccharophilum TaxID=150060 RepID=UPI00048637D8|nr:DUF4912 domain-containing protein [Halonatronum saccharophilum]